ncbi:high mobility group B protein 6-like [Thalassophryne amazonica]|uniref:high mobility group B protein 6-like n=1 Tax=Thalassophryne amazonica TaxID=390379 RepID=UPI0014726808|nr:high mobility group B protein 6-like [Thalassophryne amazonica]
METIDQGSMLNVDIPVVKLDMTIDTEPVAWLPSEPVCDATDFTLLDVAPVNTSVTQPEFETLMPYEPEPEVEGPHSAFMLFMREWRERVMNEFGVDDSEIVKTILKDQWDDLPAEEQATYYELAKGENILHSQQHPDWSAKENYQKSEQGQAVGCKRKGDEIQGAECKRKRQEMNWVTLNQQDIKWLACAQLQLDPLAGDEESEEPSHSKKPCLMSGYEDRQETQQKGEESQAVGCKWKGDEIQGAECKRKRQEMNWVTLNQQDIKWLACAQQQFDPLAGDEAPAAAPQPQTSYVKKPANAFMIFRREEKDRIMAQHKCKDSCHVNKILGELWKNMTREEKSRYFEKAKAEKLLHSQLHPHWTFKDSYGKKTKKKKNRTTEPPSRL